MVFLFYLVGMMVYLTTVSMNYSDKTKVSLWYYPAGMALSLLSNFLWMYLAKHAVNPNQIYIRGILWDSMIIFAYSILPLFVCNIKFTTIQLCGVGFVLFGLGLLKTA